jgi:hypothetical protein
VRPLCPLRQRRQSVFRLFSRAYAGRRVGLGALVVCFQALALASARIARTNACKCLYPNGFRARSARARDPMGREHDPGGATLVLPT